MARPHPMQALSDRARHGLAELPGQAARLLTKVAEPAERAGSDVRDKQREVTASVLDSAPVGDSVETRLKRARAAAERAQEAEANALEAARAAQQHTERAQTVAETNRAWVEDVRRDSRERVGQRVAEAQRAADEEAQESVRAAEAQAAQGTEEARAEADAAQAAAQERVADAAERLQEARRLAAEANQAARAAAEEAHRQAQALADEADHQVDATAQIQAGTETSAKQTARRLQSKDANGDLAEHTKAELLDLAATVDVDGRSQMTKSELVAAIRRATRATR